MVGVENSRVGKVTDWEVAVIIVIMWFLLLVPRVRVLSSEIEKERRQGFVQDTNMTNSYYFLTPWSCSPSLSF